MFPSRVLNRLPDWPERLATFIEARRTMPFRWGQNDCCLLAADAVEAITGHDLAAPWRGTYATEAEAETLLASLGGMEALVQSVGLHSVRSAYAQRGDVALVEVGNTRALGVVLGTTVAVPGPDGLNFAPIGTAKATWAV